jgi:hypothetical protein
MGFEINAREASYTAEVYTRRGGYEGHETTPSSWNLIQTAAVTSQAEGSLTPMPLLPNPVVIDAGSKQSFYITLTRYGMRYTTGSNEGGLYASDANLQFFQGIGISYPFGKSGTFRPRIWNGRIRYVVLSPGTIRELTTTTASNNGQAGNMFDVIAKQNVEIMGFKINARAGSYTAQVYTRVGRYAGHETTPSSWNLIQTATVASEAEDTLSQLPLLSNPVVVDDGSKQAFYIKLDSADMRYTNGSSEGSVFVQDENLEITEGVGKANGPDNLGFGSTFRPRVWNGRIIYQVAT